MKLPFVSLSLSLPLRPLQSSSQCIASNYLASSKPLAPVSQCIAPPYLSATASKSPPAYIWLNLAQDKQARKLQSVLYMLVYILVMYMIWTIFAFPSLEIKPSYQSSVSCTR